MSDTFIENLDTFQSPKGLDLENLLYSSFLAQKAKLKIDLAIKKTRIADPTCISTI